MMRNLAWPLSLTLAFMLALSIGLIFQLTHNPAAVATNKSNHPDTFVIQATYLRFDTQGQLQSRFYTPHMVHYTKNNLSEFAAPSISIYDQDRHPWLITAAHGKSQQGMQYIQLWGNVKVQHAANKQQQALTLLTSTLGYFPTQQLVRTDQPVTIIQPGMIVNSLGLTADLKQAKVTLPAQVRARYELPKN